MFTAVMSTPCEPIVNDHTPVHINLDIQGKVELVLLVRNHLCLSQHVPASKPGCGSRVILLQLVIVFRLVMHGSRGKQGFIFYICK